MNEGKSRQRRTSQRSVGPLLSDVSQVALWSQKAEVLAARCGRYLTMMMRADMDRSEIDERLEGMS